MTSSLRGFLGVKPADILEEVWVRDVVDLVWEILRLRRLKTSLLTVSAHKGLERILECFMAWEAANDLAKRWAAGDQSATEEVSTLLASAGVTMEAVMAQTLSVKIEDIERIDRMIMNAEARRNASLREVDRHRASLAQGLRRVSAEIEDAQFEVVQPKQIADRSAA
jgi:hypothetical protein